MQIDYRVGIPGDATDGGREWESEGVTRKARRGIWRGRAEFAAEQEELRLIIKDHP